MGCGMVAITWRTRYTYEASAGVYRHLAYNDSICTTCVCDVLTTRFSGTDCIGIVAVVLHTCETIEAQGRKRPTASLSGQVQSHHSPPQPPPLWPRTSLCCLVSPCHPTPHTCTPAALWPRSFTATVSTCMSHNIDLMAGEAIQPWPRSHPHKNTLAPKK